MSLCKNVGKVRNIFSIFIISIIVVSTNCRAFTVERPLKRTPDPSLISTVSTRTGEGPILIHRGTQASTSPIMPAKAHRHSIKSHEFQEHLTRSPTAHEHPTGSPKSQENPTRSREEDEYPTGSPKSQENPTRSPKSEENPNRSPTAHEHPTGFPKSQENTTRSHEEDEYPTGSPKAYENLISLLTAHEQPGGSPKAFENLISLLTAHEQPTDSPKGLENPTRSNEALERPIRSSDDAYVRKVADALAKQAKWTIKDQKRRDRADMELGAAKTYAACFGIMLACFSCTMFFSCQLCKFEG
ncbi:uncharacterized protein [Asterias amurensis]|uniref:uncharacterized protein isoform X2 n=1 Tax=Asterias amurensis TaxID=7602 RepID=UPI003AB2E8CC